MALDGDGDDGDGGDGVVEWSVRWDGGTVVVVVEG